jgi:cellulose synthase/poly-beta-1,6-N-acetylglucosamine synthase-like glycosyltransferase
LVRGFQRARRGTPAIRARIPPCPELDFIRDRLPPAALAIAERRALDLGVSAERVLVAAGPVTEDSYFRLLARFLGLIFEPLDQFGRDACPLDDRRLLEAAKAGLLPLLIDGELVLVVAPRSARQFMDYAARHPDVTLRLTSAALLDRFIARHGGEALGRKAAFAFGATWPQMSAASSSIRLRVALATIAALVSAGIIGMPSVGLEVFTASLSAYFLIWLGLRNLCSFLEPEPPPPLAIEDRDLPTYTIIAALYREAHAVEGLIESLRRLDYPPEKLEVKIVIEPDDIATASALAALRLTAQFDVIVAPDIGPRTKPKALNAALPFARGTFTVVYDAEDRPEPDQLRRALAMFHTQDNDLACVQARLTIDNTEDSWLARLFTAEYGAQFDLFLPGLARLCLPLPLGGSSNHFRTDILRAIGGWDAYNVTEDADLGMRLARFGYRTSVINSSTYEEAPARFGPWLKQRTRWFKGWAQTWAVHMRTPIRLLRELGFGGFMTFQLVVGGNVLAALIHPVFLALLVYTIATGHWLGGENGAPVTLVVLYLSALMAGYLTSILLGFRALAHRGVLWAAPALALVPLHWLLLSLAAWRALLQLARNPHGWEKTEHGLARSSRRAKKKSAATLESVFGRRLTDRVGKSHVV